MTYSFKSKKIILLIIVFSPFFLSAQYDYLKKEGNQLIFEKVYKLDTIFNENIASTLIDRITKIKDVTNVLYTNEIITAKISDSYIDYKQYGGKWGNTPVYMNHPFCADISIVWKEGRYKVTANNMYFNTNTSLFGKWKCYEIFINNNGFNLNKNVVRTGKYIEQYLSELFLISALDSTW